MRSAALLAPAVLLAAHNAAATSPPAAMVAAQGAGESCVVTSEEEDEARKLPWQEFDQVGDAPGSFRVLAERNCPHAALAAYDDWLANGAGFPDARSRGIGNFHRAQLLEIDGRHDEAMGLFRQSFRTQSDADPRADVWNTYVGGVLAFFAGDGKGVETARDRLAGIDDPFAQRQVGVLTGLGNCLGRLYAVAMSNECRQAP